MIRDFDKWWFRKGKSDAEILGQLGVSVPMAKFVSMCGYEAGWKDAKAKFRAKGKAK